MLHLLTLALAPALAAGLAPGPPAPALRQPAPQQRRVHVVWSNHLDIGFDGIAPQIGYDHAVINKYFHEYFPRAVRLAQDMRQDGGGDAFGEPPSDCGSQSAGTVAASVHCSCVRPGPAVYTTQSFLVSLYFDCPPGMGLRCPGAGERAALEAAIRRGDITWHAHPQ
jgi:hypothetical protein